MKLEIKARKSKEHLGEHVSPLEDCEDSVEEDEEGKDGRTLERRRMNSEQNEEKP